MNLKKYKIRTTLLVGFGIIIFLNLILVTFSIFQINRLSDLNENFYKHPFVVRNIIHNFKIDCYKMNTSIKNVITYRNDTTQFERSLNEIDTLKIDILKLFSLVRSDYLGNPQNIEDVYRYYLKWNKILRTIISDVENGNWTHAKTIFQDGETTDFANLMSSTQKMDQFAENKAKGYMANYAERHHVIYVWVMLFSFIIFFACITIALLITRSITNPINKMIHKLAVIGKNNFNEEISISGIPHLILLDQSIDKQKELSDNLIKEYNEKVEAQTKLEESKNAMVYLLEDVNEIKAELEKTVLQLQASNKELESFSYSVSHDLRAPLRAIIGFTQKLTEEYYEKFDEEGKRVTSVIIRNAEKMGRLIDDLLTFSRLGRKELNKKTVNMKALFTSTWEDLKILNLERKIKVEIHEMPDTHGDENLLRQVVTNLLTNALKFTKNKEEAIIEVGAKSEKNKNIYYVKDNGAGFNMKYVDKMFHVFQRLHSERDFEGTGIGLAIVQRIINKHGGKVWAKGIEKEGAAIYFSLH